MPLINPSPFAGVIMPQGRLTLTTGVPVVTSNVSAATTIYYTPYRGAYIPLWDGAKSVMTKFAELSQATTDATKSPAAMAAYNNYDLFVWNNAGTLRLSRGPAWTQAQTFTVTVASPGVFTITGHGLFEGLPVIPTTTGALPTGLTAGTTYFIIATGLTADAFQVSASVGGAAVNTSGTQSGVHTMTQAQTVRGTGAGTTQISMNTDGYYTNTVAITNGPGAGLGTYVGTVHANGSAQIDHTLGGVGAVSGEITVLGVWNAHNRVPTKLSNYDTTDSWPYTTATIRIKNGAQNNTIQYTAGLSEDCVYAMNSTMASNSSVNITMIAGIGYNSTTLTGVGKTAQTRACSWLVNQVLTLNAFLDVPMALGTTRISPLEYSGAAGTTTWYGDGGDNGAGSSVSGNSIFQAIVMA